MIIQPMRSHQKQVAAARGVFNSKACGYSNQQLALRDVSVVR